MTRFLVLPSLAPPPPQERHMYDGYPYPDPEPGSPDPGEDPEIDDEVAERDCYTDSDDSAFPFIDDPDGPDKDDD